MDNKNTPIRTIKVAYKAGFHTSLDPNTWSGYNEMTKFVFEKEKESLGRKLHRSFLRGYMEGGKLLRAVRNENLLAGAMSPSVVPGDSTVQGSVING